MKPSSDVAVALRNALKLGGSLLGTWAIGLVVRFQLPRSIGPERFGAFNFADSFTASLFVLCGLGVDTYVQREISVRPKHASDFFGGVLAVRAAIAALLYFAMVLTLWHTGRRGEIFGAALVFGLTQPIAIVNASLAALLQASTKVGRLAVANVTTKTLWGVAILAALALHPPLWVLAAPLLAAELLKLALLAPAARREVGLRVAVDATATRAMLRASLPFFVNTMAWTLGSKLDVTMLGFLAPGPEVGWYSAAASLAGLALLLSPVESWVLTPLLTRAHARSDDELFALLRRALEAVLLAAIPAALLLALGAHEWVHLAFGGRYDVSAGSLRILAPSFVLTYAAILLATALIILERSWTVTLVSLASLALQPLLILVVVPAAARTGVGGAGLGSACVFSFLELFSVVGFAWPLGRRALDARLAVALGKSLAACALVTVLDRTLAPLGPARLAIDAAAYAALVLGVGAVRWGDLREITRILRERRATARGAAP